MAGGPASSNSMSFENVLDASGLDFCDLNFGARCDKTLAVQTGKISLLMQLTCAIDSR